MKKYVIQIASKKPCYYTEGKGDPSRTLVLESAMFFDSKVDVLNRMKRLEKIYPNRSFSVCEIEVSVNVIE